MIQKRQLWSFNIANSNDGHTESKLHQYFDGFLHVRPPCIFGLIVWNTYASYLFIGKLRLPSILLLMVHQFKWM
jgi:hypothetical protein